MPDLAQIYGAARTGADPSLRREAARMIQGEAPQVARLVAFPGETELPAG